MLNDKGMCSIRRVAKTRKCFASGVWVFQEKLHSTRNMEGSMTIIMDLYSCWTIWQVFC